MRMVTRISIDGVFVTPHGTEMWPAFVRTGNAKRLGRLRTLLEAETRCGG
jgi:hypothetical protein